VPRVGVHRGRSAAKVGCARRPARWRTRGSGAEVGERPSGTSRRGRTGGRRRAASDGQRGRVIHARGARGRAQGRVCAREGRGGVARDAGPGSAAVRRSGGEGRGKEKRTKKEKGKRKKKDKRKGKKKKVEKRGKEKRDRAGRRYLRRRSRLVGHARNAKRHAARRVERKRKMGRQISSDVGTARISGEDSKETLARCSELNDESGFRIF
jgi:hypothetical protein